MNLANILAGIRAYVLATDSLRTEEINPLSQQFVSELLVSSAVLQSGGSPYYYPSAAGMAMAGFKDIDYDIYLLGNAAGPTNATLTIEGTTDDVTPYWHPITPAGYCLGTNAFGAASFISVGAVVAEAVLDFDEYNCKLIRVKIVISAANNCTARIYARRKAL